MKALTHLVHGLTVLTTLLALGCANGGDDNEDDDSATGEGESSDADDAVRAMNAEVRPRFLLEEQLELCAAAVFAANELSASAAFIVTGTVDIRGATPTYLVTPTDALLLREPSGDTSYVVTALAFDPSAVTLDELFLRDHDVLCTSTRTGVFSLEVESTQAGEVGERHARGTIVQDGETWDVELDETSSVNVDVDPSLLRYDGTSSRTATVVGPGLNVTSSATDVEVLLIGTDAFENRTTTSSFSGTVGGRAFALADGIIRRSFTNGLPDEVDFWDETAGTVIRDGAAFGTLAFRVGGLGTFEIVLQLAQQTEVLEQYAP